MSADAQAPRTVVGELASTLLYNREMAVKLPAPGESFALQESELTQSELQRLQELGAIKRVDREYCRSDSGSRYTRSRWQTVAHVHEWVEAQFGDVPECPGKGCRATGIRCLEPGERYSCTNESCPETFGPETATELIGR